MHKKNQFAIWTSAFAILVLLSIKIPVLFEIIPSNQVTRWSEMSCVVLLALLLSFIIYRLKARSKQRVADLEAFLEESAIISKADSTGKITYVNKRFEEISGWSLAEVIGKDHNIVNSGEHNPDFWRAMYQKVVKERQIWNGLVTNRAKDGSLYYVDTFIKAQFSDSGDLLGFMSIRQDFTDIVKAKLEIEKKNTYLEHAAKIIRHDMHSGINTYIPRGLSSLERRLPEEKTIELKIDAPLKMIKEGLRHTQKVYKGVYEFTNLVKKDAVLNKDNCSLKDILVDYLSSTAYRPQVDIAELGTVEVNEPLFCTAVDNLIRNGLKYNDSADKRVKIYRKDDSIIIEDNGRGMSQEDFKKLSQPYVRKEGQKEGGTGLGLNICIAILEEHGFSISCEKLKEGGTQIKINIKKNEN